MAGKSRMVVKDYLKQLKETKKGKPSQIKDALDIYMDLWEKVIQKGTISELDEIGDALSKIDQAGGLYDASA